VAAQNQIDPFVTWAVLIAMCCGAIFCLWAMGYRYLGPAIINIKKFEVYPITFFSDEAKASYKRLEYMHAGAKRASRAGDGNLGYGDMWSIVSMASKEAGRYYRKPVGFILIGFAVIVLFTNQQNRFKVKHSLDTLMRVQAMSWPSITPFLKYNPAVAENQRPIGARVPLKLPMFAESLYPEEWMAHNRIRVINGVPDRDQIRRALLGQLGERFDGIDNLPEHVYCLLAAFAMKGARKRKESDAFLGEIASCWTPEGGFRPTPSVKSQAAKLLNDKKVVGPLLEVMNRHAYETTALLSALAYARRQGGVLAPAQFVWLRGEDRTLWYPLNNLGRRSFHIEAAGAMAHYQSELEAGRALSMPRLEAAVVAIVHYMSETRAKIPEIAGGEAEAKALPGKRETPQLPKPTKR
jgi:intracellular multiplication protein IcmP